MRVGVIGVQGDVEEHIVAMQQALKTLGLRGEVVSIRRSGIVPSCDALVIPGGESTTLSRLMLREGIFSEVLEAAERGVPVLGTCAGMVLLAKEGDEEVAKTGQKLFGLIDAKVKRNAFGRQRESFEVALKMPAIGEEPFNAVFIRAPCYVSVGRGVEVLAKLESEETFKALNMKKGECIVAARQENVVAVAFHPELTDDLRLHHYFLQNVAKKAP
ncbi:MAG: Pyridoxal 5'-phosphate synthase subunit PdxT [Candidatus Alkanophagales archaeon MCA70_species_1]|nr:Pyridoxal 5'-phosphate synthase subunit PdxT [Candidatus Alkanophaga volatiphilum]